MTINKHSRIGVLMGGDSAERAVSLKSGEQITEALRSLGYLQVVPIDVRVGDIAEQLVDADRIEAAFIALHGTYGEDGCIQGLLEWLQIPYTGSGVAASAVAMDKVQAKERFIAADVPTPRYLNIPQTELKNHFSRTSEQDTPLEFPVFAKPRRQGSSIGAKRCDSTQALIEHGKDMGSVAKDFLIEEFIEGRELTVAFLDDRPLGILEIESLRSAYDYAAKYERGGHRYHYPPRISAELQKQSITLASKAQKSVEARGISRVDLLLDQHRGPFILEVNTLPGMTAGSLTPFIATQQGLSYPELCEQALLRATFDHPKQKTTN